MTYQREYYADPCPALTAARARAQRPAAPPVVDLDSMLDAALETERRTAEIVTATAARVAEAERVLQAERQRLARAQAQARSAAETVRVLRQRVAARAEELASLEF